MANYDAIDLDFTWDGDVSIGLDGDLADTRDDRLRSLENEIRTVVKSEFGDWQRDPGVGAGINDFRGEPNNRETARLMQDRLISRISSINIVQSEDIEVRIVPVGPHEVMGIIYIVATPTPKNRLRPGDYLIVAFSYDSFEDGIFFLKTDEAERAFRSY